MSSALINDFFNLPALRDHAMKTVESCPLIMGCAKGSPEYAHALSRGFYPFVGALEGVVDRWTHEHRDELFERLSKKKMLEAYRIRKELMEREISALYGPLAEQKASHSRYWREDAEHLGISLDNIKIVGGVGALLYTFGNAQSVPLFFACLIAGELIAITLSEFLGLNFRYTDNFSNKRNLWMDSHLINTTALNLNYELMTSSFADDSEWAPARDKILYVIELFGVTGRQIASWVWQASDKDLT